MKKAVPLILAIIVFTAAGSFAIGTTSRAVTITDEQAKLIQNNCTELRSSLTRLEQTDKLLRTNRGQIYRTLSDKLMVPLNQRLTSNQLDGGELVKTTAKYQVAYDEFYDAYQRYDLSITKAIDTDCLKEPEDFFNAVADARVDRLLLHDASDALVQLAKEYDNEFDAFFKNFNKGKS